MEPTGIVLNREQFLEWRLSIEKMLHAETKVKSRRLELSLMEKDIEISKLKAQLFKDVIRQFENDYNSSKESYVALKKRIEEELQVSLDGASINEDTLEVLKITS